MARNRMIKPEFWSSETLMKVSRDSRLTFIGIWNFCDDYGFCLNSARSLIGDIYPYDETVTDAKLKGWIGELIECKLLIPVEYESKKLLFVKGWGEHQTVQHKSKRSFIKPVDLEQVIIDSLKSHEDLIAVYLESHAPKRKKKEKEESNKEKDKGIKLPSFICPELWSEFLSLRVKIKAENTDRAITTLINKLSEMESKKTGSAKLSIEESIMNSWKGVFPPKEDYSKGLSNSRVSEIKAGDVF